MSSDRTKQICLWMTIEIYIYILCVISRLWGYCQNTSKLSNEFIHTHIYMCVRLCVWKIQLFYSKNIYFSKLYSSICAIFMSVSCISSSSSAELRIYWLHLLQRAKTPTPNKVFLWYNTIWCWTFIASLLWRVENHYLAITPRSTLIRRASSS